MPSLQQLNEPAAFLRCPLSAVEGLRPLPWVERVVMRRTFRGEIIMLGPSLDWLGRRWDVRLASVNDTIYKVALEAGTPDRTSAEDLSIAVYTRLEKELGSPSQSAAAVFLWDADDGNAVLQLANVSGDRRVMVFLTSNVVRTFARR